jgi:transketolase
MTQRDTFISNLFEQAKKDKDIILISVDMGAPSLDIWREELPEQFIAAGISEQNAINVAAGLSSAGKKVYVYFMASWVGRCWEQIRYSCAMGENPITILGCGVALGYAPAGPAHSPTEDIAYMRSINNIEIHSPANNHMAKALVDLTLTKPKLRYLRLERKFASEMENSYKGITSSYAEVGLSLVKPGLKDYNRGNRKVAILTNGYMLGRAHESWLKLIAEGVEVSLYDIWKLKPLNQEQLQLSLKNYEYIVTIEEQTLDGGFGSIISEFICDNQLPHKLLRLGLPEKFIFENGSRDHLIDTHGLSSKEITNNIKQFIK